MQLGRFEVGLDVKDIHASWAFYEKLGFKITDGALERRFVTIENGDCRLTLYQGYLDPAETQLIFVQGNVEAIAADLTAQSLTLERPLKRDATGIGAFLRDPDGHPIYFVNMNAPPP